MRALVAALDVAFGAAELVVLHAATSALGPLEGGADAFVSALREARRDRTLFVPTFTMHLADPPSGPEPAPGTDPRTPAGMGRWVERLLPFLDARSSHPTESVGALGPHASIVGPHPIDDPMGPRSPWARLVERDARVVLLGVGLERCSLLHHAERMAEVPYLDGSAYLVAVDVDGDPSWIEVVGNRCSEGFPRLLPRLAPESVRVLGAEATIVGARTLFDVARTALREDPGALLCSSCLACMVARDDIAQARR